MTVSIIRDLMSVPALAGKLAAKLYRSLLHDAMSQMYEAESRTVVFEGGMSIGITF